MELRPYQKEAEAAIRKQWASGVRRTLLVLPTGCGKTIVFCKLTENVVSEGDRVLIMAHRGELLNQAADKMLKATGLHCAVEKAEESCLGSWFRVVVVAIDRHNTTTRATSASTATTLMDWGPGNMVAFGKVAETTNTIENALSLAQIGNRYATSTPGVSGQAGYVLLAKIEITAANADTPITFVLSRRSAPSTMTVWIQFSNSAATDSSLSTIQYEGSNYGAFLVKSAELVWDFYVQKGSAYDTVSIQDWYTSKTMESRCKVTFPGTQAAAVPEPFYQATPTKPQSLLDYIFPVGTIVHRYDHLNPGTIYGGTWTRIKNTFLLSVNDGDEIGLEGGEKEVKITVEQMPAHTHGSVYSQDSDCVKNLASYEDRGSEISYGEVSVGNGKAHNNMPPYTQVSIWRREA